MNYANQLKDYVNGFLLRTSWNVSGQIYWSRDCLVADTFDEIVEHMKQVRQNNQMVFLVAGI
jgi:hypothetical protein